MKKGRHYAPYPYRSAKIVDMLEPPQKPAINWTNISGKVRSSLGEVSIFLLFTHKHKIVLILDAESLSYNLQHDSRANLPIWNWW